MRPIKHIYLLLLSSLFLASHVTGTNTIRVMTFNLRFAAANDGDNNWENPSQNPERREVVISTLSNYAADLIGFQEGEGHQLDYIDANMPSEYAFERQRPSGGSGSEYAAFSYNTNKLQLLDRGVFSLGPSPGGGHWNNTPGVPFAPFDIFPENQFAFPRIALWGKFQWKSSGQEFLFYTTHFDLYNPTFNGESQIKSAYLITDDALARNDRMPDSPLAIALGDFNGSQNDGAWKLFTGTLSTNGITGDFSDTWLETHGNFNDAGTFHGFAGGIQPASARIDWIIHRGGFTATQTAIANDAATATGCGTCPRQQYPSDHYPIITTLTFPEPLPDYDRDGLPDALELASSLSHPADPDSDNDGLLDGEEDLNGNGLLDGGESNPSNGTDTQKPSDIRNYQMDGLLDFHSSLVAQNGLKLYSRFDGRYLYLATQDAGEGSDHFIFLTSDPTAAVPTPFAKLGQVAQWDMFLADENDNNFTGWFDASKNLITNVFQARTASYFENGGWLEGVVDLAPLYGAGFTNTLYLAAAPYGTADGGALITVAQVPSGNGDNNLLGNSEYYLMNPGDLDGDGLSDPADPDQDGDGLADAWEQAHGLNPNSAIGDDGANGDFDSDGLSNLEELLGNTSPNNANSTFKILSVHQEGSNISLQWKALHETVYKVWRAEDPLSNNPAWTAIFTNDTNTIFPLSTNTLQSPLSSPSAIFRLEVLP